MAEGALDEVADLRARGLSPDLPVMRAHGVPHLIAFLDGRTDIETALVHGKADVRHYAKRQKTWFRGQMAGWTAAPPREAAAVLDRMLAA